MQSKTILYIKDYPARFVLLKVVSFDRALLKGEALRFATYFDHPLSCERPFKCQHHLIHNLECKKLTSNVHTSGSGLSSIPY
jgi:hypothetical protein